MSGVHHAYNSLGRQKKGPRYNPFKRGPKDPHKHKAGHGHWELNPKSTGKHDRYIWIHKEGYDDPYIAPSIQDRPVVQVATEIVRNAISGQRPMITPAQQTTQTASLPLPLLLLGAFLLIK